MEIYLIDDNVYTRLVTKLIDRKDCFIDLSQDGTRLAIYPFSTKNINSITPSSHSKTLVTATSKRP